VDEQSFECDFQEVAHSALAPNCLVQRQSEDQMNMNKNSPLTPKGRETMIRDAAV
jgi:hypothetical protein